MHKMSKEEFVNRYKKDLERKNRQKQREIDGAVAFMFKRTSRRNSGNVGYSTGIKSLYGGF